jgi:ABC-type antimicrobial peptide transport system permease subunit
MLVGTETRPTLLITLAACGLLLLIACSNLANLLLARNTRRRGEFAMRATLGATLSQLLRQLLVESSVLVALGAAGGMTLASLVLQLIKTSATFDLPRLSHASMRPTVAAFSIVLSAAVTVCLTMCLPSAPSGRAFCATSAALAAPPQPAAYTCSDVCWSSPSSPSPRCCSPAPAG